MTVSELKYLITANELNEGGNGAKTQRVESERVQCRRTVVCEGE